jgi:hypothetical protein
MSHDINHMHFNADGQEMTNSFIVKDYSSQIEAALASSLASSPLLQPQSTTLQSSKQNPQFVVQHNLIINTDSNVNINTNASSFSPLSLTQPSSVKMSNTESHNNQTNAHSTNVMNEEKTNSNVYIDTENNVVSIEDVFDKNVTGNYKTNDHTDEINQEKNIHNCSKVSYNCRNVGHVCCNHNSSGGWKLLSSNAVLSLQNQNNCINDVHEEKTNIHFQLHLEYVHPTSNNCRICSCTGKSCKQRNGIATSINADTKASATSSLDKISVSANVPSSHQVLSFDLQRSMKFACSYPDLNGNYSFSFDDQSLLDDNAHKISINANNPSFGCTKHEENHHDQEFNDFNQNNFRRVVSFSWNDIFAGRQVATFVFVPSNQPFDFSIDLIKPIHNSCVKTHVSNGVLQAAMRPSSKQVSEGQVSMSCNYSSLLAPKSDRAQALRGDFISLPPLDITYTIRLAIFENISNLLDRKQHEHSTAEINTSIPSNSNHEAHIFGSQTPRTGTNESCTTSSNPCMMYTAISIDDKADSGSKSHGKQPWLYHLHATDEEIWAALTMD